MQFLNKAKKEKNDFIASGCSLQPKMEPKNKKLNVQKNLIERVFFF
jgi:hypothetical protein